MADSDPDLPEWLRTRIAAEVKRGRERRRRLAGHTQPLAEGDLLAIPLPITGPDVWCITGLREAARARLAPLDQRPFHDSTDIWTQFGGADVGLRLAATVEVETEHLSVADRVDHLPDLCELLDTNPRNSGPRPGSGYPDGYDDDERAWRRQLTRAQRTLPDWLASRTLQLTPADLCDEQEFDAQVSHSPERQRAPRPDNEEQLRFAAASDGPRELFDRLLADRVAEHLWEEIACENGRLFLVVSRRGLGFWFEPEGDRLPPSVSWNRGNAAGADGWSLAHWFRSGDSHHVFWQHDWSTGVCRLRIDARRPFFIHLDPEEHWS